VLNHTFCHIPGIGPKTEEKLWNDGILSWRDALETPAGMSWQRRLPYLRRGVEESLRALELGDAEFFGRSLPPDLIWRLFPAFRLETAYLDIETNGISGKGAHITAISVYDGHTVTHYVYGRNLLQFVVDIARFKVLVTYNGKHFDVPVLERQFGIRLRQAHIDLMYVLRSLGFRGGLKGCERQLGLDREELDGVDGYFAVLLWEDFTRNGNGRALDTLLAYNTLDAANLEPLLVTAFNKNIEATPFAAQTSIPMPDPPENPYQPDLPTLHRIKNALAGIPD
jgi:uncharacterized protein